MQSAVDLLTLDDGHALAIVERDGSLSAVPVVGTPGDWRRAAAGDGTADALVRLLARTPGHATHGRFSVVSWTDRYLPGGERPITVDQTNESVIVGEQAVVKWATHLQPGPHPAPGRLAALTAAGFTATPPPWGVVTWTPQAGEQTLVATVNGYLPGAVDGWTWAKDLFIAAARSGDLSAVAATSRALGAVVADLHGALGKTSIRSTSEDAKRWRDSAFDTLAEARLLAGPANAKLLAEHADDIEHILDGLSGLVDVPVLGAHGDLHVGQVLRTDDLLVITDFDGNPVLPPAERVLPVPAAVDLAGILQSLSHVAIVAVKRSDLGADAFAEVDRVARTALNDAYIDRLTQVGNANLHIQHALGAFRLQQVLREIVYAGRHLPRWMYVPDAALPALLTEMSS
ncbi:glucosamine kinase [Mycolicibacterium frederiksbergense]|uniref:Glucosamine kinase n=1 Tax=Mycolicibacterium frederiksbergense TaxID=117567 RepID=A0A6H0S9S9_9MYCO|nr:glucosamine kinase [Mycolicibacterium frederiksbergense]QIV84372.1 aminoglycoside phosphotransferase [Mycolicibacterium frederiksbergense]